MTVFRQEGPGGEYTHAHPGSEYKSRETQAAKDEKPSAERKKSGKLKYKALSRDEMNLREKQILAELKSRDREVRNHERAHMAAAGGVARGGASFAYVTGPDGRRYAVGGEVAIDAAPASGDPERTILKAQLIRRAALAPMNPSPQDRRVAAGAVRMEQAARVALTRLEQGEVMVEPEMDPDSGESGELESSREPQPSAVGLQVSFSYGLKSDEYTPRIDLFA